MNLCVIAFPSGPRDEKDALNCPTTVPFTLPRGPPRFHKLSLDSRAAGLGRPKCATSRERIPTSRARMGAINPTGRPSGYQRFPRVQLRGTFLKAGLQCSSQVRMRRKFVVRKRLRGDPCARPVYNTYYS